MGVRDEVELFLMGLPEPSDRDRVFRASAQALAEEIDTALHGEKPRSAASAVRELRTVIDELERRREVDGSNDEGGAWGEAPSSGSEQPAVAAKPARSRAAKVRDAAEPESGDVRKRSRGGRKAAP
jgi:hypothetical protein